MAHNKMEQFGGMAACLALSGEVAGVEGTLLGLLGWLKPESYEHCRLSEQIARLEAAREAAYDAISTPATVSLAARPTHSEELEDLWGVREEIIALCARSGCGRECRPSELVEVRGMLICRTCAERDLS